MRGRKVCDVFLYYAMARSLMCKSVCDKKSREEEDLTDKKVSGHSFSSIEDHGFWGKHFLESVLKEFCFSWQYVFVIIFMYHLRAFVQFLLMTRISLIMCQVSHQLKVLKKSNRLIDQLNNQIALQ